MTPEQTQLVRQSFARMVPVGRQVAQLFYARLFELDPSLQPMFKSGLTAQTGKLMQMLGYCLEKLDMPEELLPLVRQLGRRHVAYGVRERHYDTVGLALLWTLEKVFDKTFTPPLKEAWATLYALLAATMKEGALSAAA